MNIFKLVGQIVIEKDDAVAAINDTTDTAVGYLCVTMSERAEYLADTWGCETPRRQRLYLFVWSPRSSGAFCYDVGRRRNCKHP